MSTHPVNAAVVEKNTIVRAEVLGSGKAVKMKAVTGGKYILSEGENGFAPENVTLKRSGKNLQVFLEGEAQPQLEIEGFYDTHGELVGKGEDGQWHEYIATSGDDGDAPAALLDGESTAVALGASEYAGASSLSNLSMAGLSPALIALGALAALAAATGLGYLIGHLANDDNKKSSDSVGEGGGGEPIPGDKLPNTIDNVKVVDRDGKTLPSGGSSNDNSPEFSGTGTPGNVVIIREEGKDIGSTVIDNDGNWTWKPQPPLTDGDHNFELVEGDDNGNISEPKPGPELIIDTVAPGIGAIDDLLNDDGVSVMAAGVTNDTTPTVVGSVAAREAGLRVDIFNQAGELVGSAAVAADGTWRAELTSELAEGTNELYVVVVDAAGNRSLPSAPVALEIDLTAPVMPGNGNVGPGGPLEGAWDDVEPQTGFITPGGSTNDQQPDFSGSGLEPGDIVVIRDNNQVIGTTIVGDDGSWSFTPEKELVEGDHSVDIVIRDPAGNESAPSDSLDFTVDITPPGKPTTGADGNLGLALDDVGIIVGPIAQDGATDDTRPEFNGAGLEPGDVVIISDEFNGVVKVIGSAIVGADGSWSFTPDTDLAEGDHDVRIIVKDPAGNESEPSDPYHFEIDLTAPVIDPTIGAGKPFEGAWDDVGDYQDWIVAGSSTDDARPEFKGSGLIDQAGELVIIRDNGKEIGSAVIQPDGSWSFTPDAHMANGSHSVNIILRDKAGNESTASDSLDFKIITGGAPAQPTITGVYNDDGTGEQLIQERSPNNDKTPLVRGTGGENGNIIYVYNGTTLIGSTTVQPDRTWSFSSPELPEGDVSLHVVEENAAQNHSAPSGNWDYKLDITPPVAPALSLVNDIGNTDIVIGKGDTTPDDTPILRGTSTERGGFVEVRENGVLLGTALVHADGSWTFPVPTLTEGAHKLEVVQVDAAGNRSAPAEYDFIVDTTAIAVRITHMSQDNSVVGDLVSPARTNDSTPTVHGIATPGELVTVYVDGVAVGSVTAHATSGAWQLDLSIAADGTYQVHAEVNGSPTPSGSFDVTLDTAAPTGSFDRVIDNVEATDVELASGAATRDTTPRLEGRVNMAGEESRVLVTIYNGATAVGSVYADATTGAWNWTPDPLHDGDYQFKVTFTDGSGNESAQSAAHRIIVDTTKPDAPVISGLQDSSGNPITGPGTETKPTINGTASPNEEGAIVVVTDQDGNIIGTGIVSADGSWTVTSANELSFSDYEFKATVTDKAGNTSDPSPIIEYNFPNPLSSGFEDFNNSPSFAGQEFISTTGLIIKSTHYLADSNMRLQNDWSTTPGGKALYLNLGARYTTGTYYGKGEFYLPAPAQKIEFDYRYQPRFSGEAGWAVVQWFDEAGNKLGEKTIVSHGVVGTPVFSGHIELNAPADKVISSMVITGYSQHSYIGIDNIAWGNSASRAIDITAQDETTITDVHSGIDTIIEDVMEIENSSGIIGHQGVSTLTMSGENQLLDLTRLADKVSSYEVIDIGGAGNNTLNISLGDILANGDTNLFVNDNTLQMMVKGNAGDVVNLDDQLNGTDPGDWAKANGTVEVAGVKYDVYQHSTENAELLVQEGVITNLV